MINTTEIELCTIDQLPNKANEALDYLRSKLSEIPAEYLSTAEIELTKEYDYGDDCHAVLIIRYYRPSNEKEIETI